MAYWIFVVIGSSLICGPILENNENLGAILFYSILLIAFILRRKYFKNNKNNKKGGTDNMKKSDIISQIRNNKGEEIEVEVSINEMVNLMKLNPVRFDLKFELKVIKIVDVIIEDINITNNNITLNINSPDDKLEIKCFASKSRNVKEIISNYNIGEKNNIICRLDYRTNKKRIYLNMINPDEDK